MSVTPEQTTLIITTHQRGNLLRRSLERLTGLTKPGEILVVDDGGADETEQVCGEFNGRLPIRYIYNNNPGPSICSMARNIGVRQAQHDWLVTSEPELIWETDVLAQFCARHEEYPNEIISAGVVHFAGPGYEPGATAGDYQPPVGAQEAVGWVAPYTALWKKSWLTELGGWDEAFPGYWGWDDIDLLTRLRINGHGQYIDLDIKATHQFHGIGGDHDFINERYFFGKSFTHAQEKHICHEGCPQIQEDLTDLVANQGREWGVVVPR